MKIALISVIAQIGYIARALMFISIGTMTLLAAWGLGGREAGFQDAVQTLLREPVGQIAALGLAFGLACFAIWRFAEALMPFDNRPKSLFQRAAFAGSGLLYLGMTIWTVSLALGARVASSSSDQQARRWTEWILGHPYGAALVVAAGIATAAVGISLFIRAIKPDFERSLALRPDAPAFIAALGRYGVICRALVFAEIGGFLIYAAVTFNSRQAKGMEGAFRTIKQLEYGYILLAITAAGFIAFGLFDLGKAFYRNLNPRNVAADP
jgi:hypothetical protein